MKVLVVGAHPDDETFGMGATLAKHIAAGDEVRVLVLADGVTARNGDVTKQIGALATALRVYGVAQFDTFCGPDQQLDNLPLLDLVRGIEAVLRDFRPSVVYTHSAADVGQDHRRVHEAVMVACRPVSGVKKILCFAVPSSSFWGDGVFKPNVFVDVTQTYAVKQKVLNEAYIHEVKASPNPRSWSAMEQRAKWLAELNGIDGYAEEFELIRSVE